ncbi:hypothetical protein BCR41DRAFT_45614 [Lobosporangium transversale]|uniref:Uncharacterized protein n=1 Tax=Lobosporangium transversale TaxID=64571 RepID=A0A1Y2GQ05_9FUNG|nr:hypothetical protein BCR41DRAFT_45614 [Lobosporangium transversale]ORZ18340.1 hypothetical protein BCR41DRAFT_45614 [Lobosporangium transversale]|eukprot:XP_021882135.1 hypothetical protein BCR41DRAFT_45614 [Lobosporangium transversale]
MRKELAELTMMPEPQRKPISSDVQQVLNEMEELRKQFSIAKTEHQKQLEDMATQREKEIAELKEKHDALLSAMIEERDSIADSLKSLKASGELTEREKDAKIKELEEQIEKSLKEHAEVLLKHADALEVLRADMEAAWTAKYDSKVQELTKVHAEELKDLEEKRQVSKDAEIQELKDSFSQQIKALEEEQEKRITDLNTKHASQIQDWKDKLSHQADASDELIGKLKSELKSAKAAKEEVEAELNRVNEQTQEQLNQVRAEMEEIRKLLAAKEAETAELQKRVDELTDDLENASISAMLKNTKRYKVKQVQIYGSSVSGNLKVKRAQQSISDTLEQLDIEFEFVDVSVDEDAKWYMRRKNGGEKQLPQIFSGGEYRGIFEDFEYAIETHQLTQFLGFDRIRGFVPRNKMGVDSHNGNGVKSTTQAQDGEDAEQGAGFPSVVVNGMGHRSSISAGNNKDVATSMYLLSPASNRFHSTASLASVTSTTSTTSSRSNGSLKAGFVQNASQVWDGALKNDITHVKHNLGFANPVIPDDEELEELFEQGAVTEEELQALLNM